MAETCAALTWRELVVNPRSHRMNLLVPLTRAETNMETWTSRNPPWVRWSFFRGFGKVEVSSYLLLPCLHPRILGLLKVAKEAQNIQKLTPENRPLEKEIPIFKPSFLRVMVVFGCIDVRQEKEVS